VWGRTSVVERHSIDGWIESKTTQKGDVDWEYLPDTCNSLSLDWVVSRRDCGTLRANKIMADEHGDGTNEGRMLG
jgi:hypothetical protein